MPTLFLSLLLMLPQPKATEPPSAKDILSRFMYTLADDTMQGRRWNEPGGAMAAKFLADEFKQAGLSPLPGHEDFAIPFSIYTLESQTFSGQVEHVQVDPADLISLCTQPYVQLNHGQTKIESIGAGDNFREKMKTYMGLQENLLVLIHPQHQPTLMRYANYFKHNSKPTLHADGHAGPTFFVSDQTHLSSFQIELQTRLNAEKAINVVGYLKGTVRADENILFSAHYDHLGLTDKGEDKVFNGADDNASGVSIVLALAGHFGKLGAQPRSLVFACLTAEEIGLVGAKHLAAHIQPETYVANINFEMVGKPSHWGLKQAYMTGFHYSDMGNILQQALDGSGYTLNPSPYPQMRLFFRSDNIEFAQRGIPAHTVATTPADNMDHYHQPFDEISGIDLENMTETLNLVLKASKPLIDGSATPSRISLQQE